jgi:hypothetical protein
MASSKKKQKQPAKTDQHFPVIGIGASAEDLMHLKSWLKPFLKTPEWLMYWYNI